MEQILIVGNGRKSESNFLRKLSKNANFVIGVDGGAETLLNENIRIDLAIGDFDSISNKALLKEIRTIEFPKDKDYSDTELAINYAIKLEPKEIILTNMLGGRTDHLLFNISLLSKCVKKRLRCFIKEEIEEVYATNSKVKIPLPKNSIVSLVPVTQRVRVESTSGLKYALINKTLVYGTTLTLSNISITDYIEVSVGSGTLLVVVNKF